MNSDELTNLLPLERQKMLRHHYFIRVGVVGMILFTCLLGATSLLLFPTYALLSQTEADKQAILNSAATALSSADEQSLSSRLVSLTENAKMLSSLGTTASVSTRIATLLAASRLGVTLSGFSYLAGTPQKGTTKATPATMTVSGIAATRDTLRNYQLALQAIPFVAAAVLPVSAYAQSTDIPFTINLTLTL